MIELIFLHGHTGHQRSAGEGRLIVPCVALREGVIHAVNSRVPEFVPYSTLLAAPQAWNGKPAVLGHPTSNGVQISANDPRVLESHGLGTIQRARCENRRLVMDLHFDEQRAERIGAARLLARLRNGEQIDVSIGAFVRTEPKVGVHEGKRYEAIWTWLRPDHIAILPDQRGACSCSDGCGTYQRAAEDYATGYGPIDSYAPALAKLRAASRLTPEQLFAQEFRAVRFAQLEAEYAA